MCKCERKYVPIFFDANWPLLAMRLTVVLHALHVVVSRLLLDVVRVLLLVLRIVVVGARTAGATTGDDRLLLDLIIGGWLGICLHWGGLGLGVVGIVAGGVLGGAGVVSSATSLTDRRRDPRQLLRRPLWARRGCRENVNSDAMG